MRLWASKIHAQVKIQKRAEIDVAVTHLDARFRFRLTGVFFAFEAVPLLLGTVLMPIPSSIVAVKGPVEMTAAKPPPVFTPLSRKRT